MSAIEVAELKKSYGPLLAVDGISFSVRTGEIFSMLGPNGAGKTTTVEILEGLRRQDSGTALVLGNDPWKEGPQLHRRIGVIPQGFHFFDKATPREAIRYYADLFGVKADAERILQEVILEDASNSKFENLSGGQKQKVGLALALVNDPELLFLDEPTTGLDPQARRAVWHVIRNLKRAGRTVFLTTHYLEEAEQLSDRVAIMNKGHIVASGSPYEIISANGTGERIKLTGDKPLYDYLRGSLPLEVNYDEQEKSIVISLRDKRDAITALEAISRSNFEWTGLNVERESLEDVFIRLVGTRLNEEGEAVGGEGQGTMPQVEQSTAVSK